MPLEPFDPAYLEEHKIKSMSFHAYLRKLGAHEKKQGTNYITLPSLEEPSYKVKTNCSSGHPPWPASICTKCQPSAITLQRQVRVSAFWSVHFMAFDGIKHYAKSNQELVLKLIDFPYC